MKDDKEACDLLVAETIEDIFYSVNAYEQKL